jgi:hypothetical protein
MGVETMESDDEIWCLQVWSDKPRGFWDAAFWLRGPGDKKGVASFIDATPRLSWMAGKKLADVWAYLLEHKRLGRLEFSFTQENDRLLQDLLRVPPSATQTPRRGSSR